MYNKYVNMKKYEKKIKSYKNKIKTYKDWERYKFEIWEIIDEAMKELETNYYKEIMK